MSSPIWACSPRSRRCGAAASRWRAIADLAGLARTNPKLALVFSMLFLSLAGLPPLAGFFAKFYVFLAAIQAGLVWPAILGVLASAIGLVYYLRLVKVMYFDEPAAAFDADMALGSRAILVALRRGGAAVHLRRFAGHHRRRRRREGAAALTSWPQGYGLKRYDEIDSTNEEARRLAAAGEAGPAWLTAARQTAGRGRRGRAWETAGGNLAATLAAASGSRPRRMGAIVLRRGASRRPTWRRISRPQARASRSNGPMTCWPTARSWPASCWRRPTARHPRSPSASA